MQKNEAAVRKEIAVVGGGLGGCLTALMLARNPEFHVTLIEAKPTLLNGASRIASRLHLGGEYPLDPVTARDCLLSAMLWKLLMPTSIYTPVDPMKFLIAQKTEEWGMKHPKSKKSLTLDIFEAAYEKIRVTYQKMFGEVKEALGWTPEQTQKALFGSYERNIFFRKLAPEEYSDYNKLPKNAKEGTPLPIAGGFQSQELGINVAKNLAMIEKELRKQEKKGNITILTDHKVNLQPGVTGKMKNGFELHCENNQLIKANMIVNAAWSGGQEITPASAQDEVPMQVFKRAMLRVKLPPGFKTNPAFIMLGKDGGMLSPYSLEPNGDNMAICYLPVDGAAYPKNKTASLSPPYNLSLPDNWNTLSKKNKNKWTNRYFNGLKERFPILEGATEPYLEIEDTISFDDEITKRRLLETRERAMTASSVKAGASLQMNLSVQPKQTQKQEPQFHLQLKEGEPGFFTLYPTKATYSLDSAIQAALMVEERHRNPDVKAVLPAGHALSFILKDMEKYSLRGMEEPTRAEYDKFFKEHPDLTHEMIKDKFPKELSWTEQVRFPQDPRRGGGPTL